VELSQCDAIKENRYYPRCEQVRARGEGFAMVAPREDCALKRAGVTQSPSGGEGWKATGPPRSIRCLFPAGGRSAVGSVLGLLATAYVSSNVVH